MLVYLVVKSNPGQEIRHKYCTISCPGLCLNYLEKISQMWWSSVGSILQYAVVVSGLPVVPDKDLSNVVVQCS